MFRGRFLNRFLSSGSAQTQTNQEYIQNKLKALARRYRKGMADALGVPEDWIREDVVERWLTRWVQAFVRPEYWSYVLSHSMSEIDAELLGYDMGTMIKRALQKKS